MKHGDNKYIHKYVSVEGEQLLQLFNKHVSVERRSTSQTF